MMKNIILPIAVAAAVSLPSVSEAQVRINPDPPGGGYEMPLHDMFSDPFSDPFFSFDAFFDPMPFPPAPAGFADNGRRTNGYRGIDFSPRMDVADIGDKIEITAELPGMDENDVVLSLDNNVLTIKGERKQEQTEKTKNYYLKEISSGQFRKAVRLPENVDGTKIDAVFKNGILTITVPKLPAKEDTAKKIPIRKG